jgi:valyl-tRNA synthetase
VGVDESPNEIDSEGNELSEEDSLNVQVGEDTGTVEPQTHPTPEEINRTIEPPLSIDGDKLVEKQEEPKPKKSRKKISKQEQLTHKLYNQLIKKLQSDKTHKELEQIQKQLAQVEKNTTNIKLQQQLGKELLAQVRLMQRRLEKIDNAISRSKNKGNVKRAPSRKVTKS